jgi:hypothetical protein
MAPKAVRHGLELRLDAAVSGLKNAPKGLTKLTVGGVVYTVADLLKNAEEIEKSWKDARAARALLAAITQNRPKVSEAAREFLADLKAALVAALGRESQELTNFGFQPQQRRAPLTTEQSVLRAAKAKMSPEKRHTMGSRQKESLRETGTPSVTVDSNGSRVAEQPTK